MGLQPAPGPADVSAAMVGAAVCRMPQESIDVEPEFELVGLTPPVEAAARYVLRPGTAFPILAGNVADVLKLSTRPEAAFRDVDAVVRRDPILAARVLSVANSPLYRPPTPITSLRTALIRLGWSHLREILMQAVAESHIFRHGPRRELSAARVHSVAVAHVHRHIAYLAGLDGEHAFACGLLHDLGRPMAYAALTDKNAPPLTALERATTVDAIHTIVGERVARSWNLPDVVARVCRSHHDETDGASVSSVGAASVTLCEALIAPNLMASMPAPPELRPEEIAAALRLSDADFLALQNTVAEACAQAN